MFSVMGIINIAHGSLAVLAAYRALRARRPFRHLAVPRARRSSCPRWRLIGWGCSAPCSSAARAAGCWCRCSHFRPVDRHRQSAVRAIRRRHPLARALYRHPFLRFLGAHRRHRHRQARGADLRDGDRPARRHPALSIAHAARPGDPRHRRGRRHRRPRRHQRAPRQRDSPPAIAMATVGDRGRVRSRCARPSIPTPARRN